MNATAHLLAGDFTLCDLGSASATDLPGLRPLRSAITLIEIDAIGQGQTAQSDYYRKISLQSAISGHTGRRTFHKRQFAQSSSFLEIKADVASSYGLEAFFAPAGDLALECETLATLLAGHGLARVDFLKTDLEGIDFEVLSSAPDIVGRSLVIQNELRFQPLYEGEADFCAVSTLLAGLGFELITLRPEVWKYATPNRDVRPDGRLVWADAIFFLTPRRLEEIFGDAAPLAVLKQALLANALRLPNVADYLFESVRPQLPAAVAAETAALLGSGTRAARLANGLAALPGGNRLMLKARGLCLAAARTLSYSKGFKHIGFPY